MGVNKSSQTTSRFAERGSLPARHTQCNVAPLNGFSVKRVGIHSNFCVSNVFHSLLVAPNREITRQNALRPTQQQASLGVFNR